MLAGSGNVSRSTKMPTGVGEFIGSSEESGNSKVSRRVVMKEEIFSVEPSSPNKTDTSVGSTGSIVVAEGSSKSMFDKSKSNKSVGGSSRLRVFLRLSEDSFSNPKTIRLRKDAGEEGVGD